MTTIIAAATGSAANANSATARKGLERGNVQRRRLAASTLPDIGVSL